MSRDKIYQTVTAHNFVLKSKLDILWNAAVP